MAVYHVDHADEVLENAVRKWKPNTHHADSIDCQLGFAENKPVFPKFIP